MREYLLVMLIAGSVTFAITPLVRWFAIRAGAITPVRGRDVHVMPKPRLGGLAMLAGLLAATLMAARLPYLSQIFADTQIRGILLAAIVVWAITFWNRRSLRRSPVLIANSQYMDRIPSFARAQRAARVRARIPMRTGVDSLGVAAAAAVAFATLR